MHPSPVLFSEMRSKGVRIGGAVLLLGLFTLAGLGMREKVWLRADREAWASDGSRLRFYDDRKGGTLIEIVSPKGASSYYGLVGKEDTVLLPGSLRSTNSLFAMSRMSEVNGVEMRADGPKSSQDPHLVLTPETIQFRTLTGATVRVARRNRT